MRAFLYLLLLFWALPLVQAERTRLLMLSPTASLQGQGGHVALNTWGGDSLGWVYPSTYSLSVILPEEREFHNTQDLVTSLGFGISFMHLSPSGVSPSFGFGMNWGSEEVDSSYRNFFMGLLGHQTLFWIPRSRIGLVPGLGIFESYSINSELSPWDLGVNAVLGLKF